MTLTTEPTYSRGEFEGSPLDGLEPLRRREVAIALGGRQGIANAASDAHRRDRGQLLSRHQHTAAELLEWLAVAAEEREIDPSAIGTQRGIDRITLDHVYLANHIYLRTASLRFQQQIWMQGFD